MHEHKLAVITPQGLTELIDTLRAEGFRVIGPTLRDQAIVYDEIKSVSDLPAGWTDEQDGGHYRVRRRDDAALFGYNVGPHSWKRFLTRRCWDYGARSERKMGSLSPGPLSRRRNTPSSLCGPASCMQSPSRIACSCKGRMSTRTTRHVGKGPSSLR